MPTKNIILLLDLAALAICGKRKKEKKNLANFRSESMMH